MNGRAMTVECVKTFDFCYGHYLPGYDGKCGQQHGHNAKLAVKVGLQSSADRFEKPHGFVIDFSQLKAIVEEKIIKELDHTNLNDIMSEPSCENIAVWIATRLYKILWDEGLRLVAVKLSETDDSYCVVKC